MLKSSPLPTWIISSQQMLDEGCLSSRVLTQKHNHWLAIKVAFSLQENSNVSNIPPRHLIAESTTLSGYAGTTSDHQLSCSEADFDV
jgi:hypothetical protein